MLNIKKHITIVFVFVLFIPSTIQVLHAFENHEHTVCKSVGEHHIHKQELDCSELHFPFKTFSAYTSSTLEVIPEHFYNSNFDVQPQQIKVVYISKKSSRAPPVIA